MQLTMLRIAADRHETLGGPSPVFVGLSLNLRREPAF
jgi:hypothetical protein